MISFILTEVHLRSLSPETRSEVLELIDAETKSMRDRLNRSEWSPERTQSYPLSLEEAHILLSNTPRAMRAALRIFCENFDGKVGRAELGALMEATACKDHEELNQVVTELLQSLQQVTGDREAWLLNWHADDWEWSDEEQCYVKGSYFISGTAINSLREAFAKE